MADATTSPDRVQPARRRSTRSIVVGFIRLSKLNVYQHYYGLVLAWLMVPAAALHRPGVTAAMLLFLVSQVGVVACTCAADDLTGYRNGSDAANYKPGDLGRNYRTKPLLTGVLTERDVVAFVAASAAVAVAAGLAGFTVLGWHVPPAAVLVYVASLATTQYSAGLRISYVPAGTEILLCLETAAGLLYPYLAVARQSSATAVIVALILGMWLVMVSTYSNVKDAAGDAAVGRRTLATLGPAVYKTAMVVFYLTYLGLTFALALATNWPWWTLLTLLPVTTMRTVQMYEGPVRNRWLLARKIGFLSYDAGFLGLLIPAVIIR
jgi:1,4-dihydroxy-2-naphthoate octaprenyltransferase